MNADRNNEPLISKHLIWGAAVIAFLVVFGSVWLASSFLDEVPTSADLSKPRIPTPLRVGSGPRQVYLSDRPALSETPSGVASHLPDLSSSSSQAKVTVRPAHPQPTGRSRGFSGSPAKRAEEKTSPVSDMFPVGRVIERTTRSTHSDMQAAQPLPSFEYAGRTWKPTGTYALSGQVDLAPTGLALGGRDVYALANADTAEQVLFMQSSTNPGKYAIYRTTQG